jgi:hypothetical protein
MYPDGTLVQQGHSAPDPNGLFASQMRFELAAGTTPAQCMGAASDRLSAYVQAFESGDPGEDGRLTGRGESDRYAVTVICGVVGGKSIASVNYRWTK